MRLHLDALCKSFGRKKILDHLSLSIDQPGIWALIGPNGAGKTTLLDCIANLQSIDSGTIEVLGKPCHSPDFYRSFSYLQDNRVLYPELTGLEHLRLIQKIHNLPPSRIEEVIEEIGIRNYCASQVKSYSLGMKQHLLIALAIMNQPKLLLLDEPLNGLDPSSYIETRKLLQRLAQNGATIIISSHQLNEVDQLTNKLLFLKNGKIIPRELSELGQQYQIKTSNTNMIKQKLGAVAGLRYLDDLIQLDTALYPLNDLLKTIVECDIAVLHVDLIERQSEDIYTELFGG